MPSFFKQQHLLSKNKPRLESTKRGCFLLFFEDLVVGGSCATVTAVSGSGFI